MEGKLPNINFENRLKPSYPEIITNEQRDSSLIKDEKMKNQNINLICPIKVESRKTNIRTKNHVIDNSQLRSVINRIINYISKKGHNQIDVPILMERDIQDGVFIEDNKIFKTTTKSIRYDLTLPLFIYFKENNIKTRTLSFTEGKVFRVEEEDESHFSEFNQFEIDIFNPESIFDDVLIGDYMKEIAKMFFGEDIIELRINYRPLTEWLISLSKISDRQEFYNRLDSLDKEFSNEKCKEIFQDNFEVARNILQSSSVEELERINIIPKNIVEYFRSYKKLSPNCIIRPLLARGALYYDGVVYEMFHPKLGSAIMGGGHGTLFGATRVGASFGLERLLICINQTENEKSK